MGSDPTTTPAAEAGFSTSEFKLTAITALATALLGLLVAFGVPLTSDQRASILTVIAASLPVMAMVYTLARTWRKRGTVG